MAKPDPTPVPTEIVVTPEMRQAVYAEDCLARGHILEFSTIIEAVSDTPPVIGGISDLDETQLPYIECSRCGSVWIVFPHAGSDYDDAERFLYDKLNPNSAMAKKIVRDRGERERNPKKPKKLSPRLEEA